MAGLVTFNNAYRAYAGYKFAGKVQNFFTAQEVLGVNFVIRNLTQLGVRMAISAAGFDSRTAQKLVDAMRAKVPQDTGRLFSGITATRDGAQWLVEASAVRTGRGGKEQEDYAYFVEKGTRAGRRGRSVSYVADGGFFSDQVTVRPTPRTRRQYRTHPGTPAQPFFFNSIEEVMGEQRADAARAANEAARAAGWELH